jgi:hypothetical protein
MDPFPDKVYALLDEADQKLSETGWQVEIKNDIHEAPLLESKQFPGFALPHYRASVIINMDRKYLSDIIFNNDEKKAQMDDPGIISLAVLEKSENHKIRYQVNYLGHLISNRETVFAQYKLEKENVTYLVGYSVDHPAAGGKGVRTEVAMSVYKYTSLEENKTLVQRIANVNPGGWIPTFVITAQAGKMIDAFKRWKALEK